jgi:hypothetical protein
MKIISCKQAKQKKLSRYFTGKACIHGHICERRTINKNCVTCCNEKRAKYVNENRGDLAIKANQSYRVNHEKYRAYGWKTKGMPTPTRPEPLVCEICGKPETRKSKNGNICAKCNDHDNDSGKFRGWLCFSCNTGIGLLSHSEEIMNKAIIYLQNFKKDGTV